MEVSRRAAGVWAALDRQLARLGAERVFALCLAVLAGAILVGYVLPLTGGFVSLHEVPTTTDHHAIGKDQGHVTVFWVASTAAFALAVLAWRRGLRPSPRLLVAGAVGLNALALLVPPVFSEDVYTYSFYGVVQDTYGESPYAAIPESHPLHPWYPFWSWRDTSAVYGPPFLLLLRGVAAAAGGSMLAWVVWMKLLLVAFGAAGVWLLERAAARGGGQARGWPLLLLAWNPMVLQSVAMSAHVDAVMLTAVAGALAAHRRGAHLERHAGQEAPDRGEGEPPLGGDRRRAWGCYLLAFALLVLAFLTKLYMGPVVALYGLWLALHLPRPGARRSAAALAALGAGALALTVLTYLPHAGAGAGTLLRSVLEVGQGFSSGSPPNVVRRLLATVLPWFGLSDTTAIAVGTDVARALSAAAVLALGAWCAWRLRTRPDPWPLLATWLTGYLLLGPWVFYWHLVPLLGIVAAVPWSATSLVAVVMSLNLVPLAPGGRGVSPGGIPPPAVELGQTLVGHASRYAATDATLLLLLLRRRAASRRRPAPGPAPVPGHPPARRATSTR